MIDRVLVIDDDESVTELIRDYLKHWEPSEIVLVGDGAAAWDHLQKKEFSLVVLDWRLPKVNGMVLFNRLRTLPAYEKTPVLVSSGLLLKEDFSLLSEYPCTQSIAKPYREKIFKDAVERLFSDCAWHEKNKDLIAKCMSDLGSRKTQAVQELQKLLQSHPNNAAPLVLMAARAAAAQGDLNTAQALLRNALKKDPQCVPALFELGKLLFQSKDLDAAMTVLEKAQQLSPKNLNRGRLMGEVSLNQLKPQAADAYFKGVLKHDQNDTQARKGESVSAAMSAHLEGAADEGGGQVGKSLASMINLIAIGLVRQKRYDEGMQRYREALDFIDDPLDRARLAFNLGLACTRSGRDDEGRTWFEQADRWSGGTLAKAKRWLDPEAAVGGDRAALDELDEIDDIQPETFGRVQAGAAPEAASSAPPLARKHPEPVAVKLVTTETLRVPTKAADPQRTLALIAEALAAQVKNEAQAKVASAPLAQVQIFLYHPLPAGWQRAQRQLQLLEAGPVMGYSEPQVLLDAVRLCSRPLVLIWLDADEKNQGLQLLEALYEARLTQRVGVLVHCVGEQVVIAAKTKKPYLPYDMLLVVNWVRARFEDDLRQVTVMMNDPHHPLSRWTQLAQLTAQLAGNPGKASEVLGKIAELRAKNPPVNTHLWFDLLKLDALGYTTDAEAALLLAQSLQQAYPDLFSVRASLAAVAARSGEPSQTLAVARWLFQTSKASAGRLTWLAQTLLARQQHDAVRQLLASGADHCEFHLDYRYHLIAGKVLLAEGQFAAAQLCFEAAIAVYPLDPHVLLHYAAALLDGDDAEAANQVIDMARQCTAAPLTDLLQLQVRTLRSLGQQAAADACLKQLGLIDPQRAAAFAKLPSADTN